MSRSRAGTWFATRRPLESVPPLIAGLEEINGGAISIGRRVAHHVPARERDIAMLSPGQALYPRLTVEQNLAFGLRLRGTPSAEIARRVTRAARILGLEP